MPASNPSANQVPYGTGGFSPKRWENRLLFMMPLAKKR
jgi:hypothetical protein